MSKKRARVCDVESLGVGEARSFILGEGASRLDVVVVRTAESFIAYVNSCPHQLTPLETFPGQFWNEDKSLLVCSTHGARFRVSDGVCVSGPCEGKRLTKMTISISEGSVFLTN